mgnify:CR=1 FL=1
MLYYFLYGYSEQMSFIKSIFYGIKQYFFVSLAIGIAFFIEIQRNDLKGNISETLSYIEHSIDILTLAFPFFCYYIGSKQSNLIKRKTDSGFAAAISASIGFMLLLYMNWGIVLGSLWVADYTHVLEWNEFTWRIIPSLLAGLFSAIVNNSNQNKQIDSKKSNESEKDSPTPWVYSVGVVDEHGFEWTKHNNKQWYRTANSGDEWKEYS